MRNQTLKLTKMVYHYHKQFVDIMGYFHIFIFFFWMVLCYRAITFLHIESALFLLNVGVTFPFRSLFLAK